ncbi:MAG: NADH-quinone oxidoreductase subunit L, partial [Candidatus Methanospirareceae archaeon]
LIHEGMFLPIILLLATSVTYSAILAKFLSLNFIKGEKPHHEHLEGGNLMKLGYSMMVSMLFILFYLIFTNKETEEFIHAGLAKTSIGVGIAILVAYVVALYKPRISALSKVGTFLNDRLYLIFLNDFICPKVGFPICHAIENYANRGIDALFNTKVFPGMFERASKAIRTIQTGPLQIYIKIVLGIVMVLLIITSSIGGLL